MSNDDVTLDQLDQIDLLGQIDQLIQIDQFDQIDLLGHTKPNNDTGIAFQYFALPLVP